MGKSKSVSKFNHEGYADPTAHEAMNNVQKVENEADDRASKLIMILKYIIEKSNFRLLARIEIKDSKTGREYR